MTFKNTRKEKAPSSKTPALTWYGHLGRWYIKSTLYKRFLNWKKNVSKNNAVTGKTSFFMIGPFCTSFFTFGFWYDSFSFLKKVFVFEKICFKVKVLKTFKIFTDCTHKSKHADLSNGVLFWKSLVSFFRRTYTLSVGFKMKPLRKSVF